MESPNDRPPLVDIAESGTYVLKLSLPKPDRVKVYDDGVSAWLFFKTAEGKCLTKSYGTRYGNSLAMLVGKVTRKYVAAPKPDMDVQAFIDYIAPAANIYFEVAVEVTPDLDENKVQKLNFKGQPKWKYKLNFPKGKAANTVPTPTDW